MKRLVLPFLIAIIALLTINFVRLSLPFVQAFSLYRQNAKTNENLNKKSIINDPPNSEKLFNLVNSYRNENGLPDIQKDESLCKIAKDRSHDEFDNHAGLYVKYKDYPYIISENIVALDGNYNMFSSWKQSKPHNAAMLGNWKYACVSCAKMCVQIFSSFTR